jgi:hypothetical protein
MLRPLAASIPTDEAIERSRDIQRRAIEWQCLLCRGPTKRTARPDLERESGLTW